MINEALLDSCYYPGSFWARSDCGIWYYYAMYYIRYSIEYFQKPSAYFTSVSVPEDDKDNAGLKELKETDAKKTIKSIFLADLQKGQVSNNNQAIKVDRVEIMDPKREWQVLYLKEYEDTSG